MDDFNRKRHAVYKLTYHAVFVIKYRRKVMSEPIIEHMRQYAAHLIGQCYQGRLIELNGEPDHIHILFELPATAAPSVVVASLVVLYFGADFLVKGSSSLAVRFGISPLVVGLTVVAFGTSAPELLVSVQSALEGNPGIAVGNVMGSNIFNVCAILGISAMIYPLRVNPRLIRLDAPVMLAATLLFVGIFHNGSSNI